MPEPPANQVTRLLGEIGRGDHSAADRLFPLVYGELRALAGSFFAGQSPGHTLQPTALVHDAYLKMVGAANAEGASRESAASADGHVPKYKDRSHFFAVAAKAMRQILTDHARKAAAIKRGGHDATRIELNDDAAVVEDRELNLVSLDEAMQRLAQLDPRKVQVIELRFFGGLTNDEVADVLDISRATVADDWTVARAWLRAEMSK